jgi:hypothetical protein
MKLQRQGPSLSWAPSKALGGALVICSHGQTFLKKKIAKVTYLNHSQLSIVERPVGQLISN